MPPLSRILARLPVPTETRLAWQRALLDRAYAKSIAEARTANDMAKVQSLESDHRFEIAVHEEDEDGYVTRQLLSKARRLRIPIPHLYDENQNESKHWYQGHMSGRWYLSPQGEAALRDEIRKELKARHDARSQWVVWISVLTGLIGALTSLVALLSGTGMWSP
jgi:hypothetical protein